MNILNRIKIIPTLEPILRVPPLFVIDSILNSSLENFRVFQMEPQHLQVSELNLAKDTFENDNFLLIMTHSLGWLLLYSLGLLASLSTFLLSTDLLLSIYLYLPFLGLVIWSNSCNEEFMAHVASKNPHILFDILKLNIDNLGRFLANCVAQSICGTLFFFAIRHFHWSICPKSISILFITPSILALIPGLPSKLLLWIPRICSFIALLYLVIIFLDKLGQIIQSVIHDVRWSRRIIRNYGIYTLMETQWARLHIPQVLRIFWLTRFCEQALLIVADTAYRYYYGPEETSFPFDTNFMRNLLRDLMVKGCETIVALLGMTSLVASVSTCFVGMTQSFLQIKDSEDQSMGTVSAILFLILALQTGLTGLEPEKRFLRLYRNICLMLSASLHFIHNIVSPYLFSLSVSRNQNFKKHSRAWLVCFFLLAFPVVFLHFSWKNNPLNTWLLSVTFFQVEVIIKVIITLLIYILFMIDSYRVNMSEKLDDYVYYLRAIGNTIDFIFGLLIFLNGAWILLFESGGTIRAITVCLHAYFNIWLQAKFGWKTFMRRRSAAKLVQGTREATQRELELFDDICPICYQEFLKARITRCNHYFHELCLRKWLYVQDVCPICHQNFYEYDNVPDSPNSGNPTNRDS